jgi:hypothetical protein
MRMLPFIHACPPGTKGDSGGKLCDTVPALARNLTPTRSTILTKRPASVYKGLAPST